MGLRREDLVYAKVAGVNALRCPKHVKFNKSKAVFVIIQCADCGTLFVKTMKAAKNVYRCVSCQHLKNIQTAIKRNKKIREAQPKKVDIRNVRRTKYNHLKDLARRQSCRYAMVRCYKTYDRYDNMPCKGCKHYQLIDPHCDGGSLTRRDCTPRSKHRSILA